MKAKKTEEIIMERNQGHIQNKNIRALKLEISIFAIKLHINDLKLQIKSEIASIVLK